MAANGRFLRHRPRRSERCHEVREIVPRPVSVAKDGRCAEGLSVKPMLCANDGAARHAFHQQVTRKFSAVQQYRSNPSESNQGITFGLNDQAASTYDHRRRWIVNESHAVEANAYGVAGIIAAIHGGHALQERMSHRIASDLMRSHQHDQRQTEAIKQCNWSSFVCEIESPVRSFAHNGRFLRHRPKRSEQCLNYQKLYQGHGPLPKSQGVPKASA